jgi:adenylate kinase family enzyme
MKKIIIVGSTGSGKSTLATKLSEKTGIPYIHLDALYWKPDWQGSHDDEFIHKVSKALDIPQWIVDGNYRRTNHLTYGHADTVVWVDMPFWLTFYQSLKRAITRSINKKELWPGTGNKESFSRMLSKESILLWLFKTYKPNIERYEKLMTSSEYPHIKFYRLKSRKEVSRFLESA